jgi:hypothetical protein
MRTQRAHVIPTIQTTRSPSMRIAQLTALALPAALIMLAPSDASAQRRLNCQSSDAKAMVLDLVAKQRKQTPPRAHLTIPKAAHPTIEGTFTIQNGRPSPASQTFTGRGNNQVHLVSSPDTAIEINAQHSSGGPLLFKVCHYRLRGGVMSIPKTVDEVIYHVDGHTKTISSNDENFNEKLRGKPGQDAHVSLVWVSPAEFLTNFQYRLNTAPLR